MGEERGHAAAELASNGVRSHSGPTDRTEIPQDPGHTVAHASAWRIPERSGCRPHVCTTVPASAGRQRWKHNQWLEATGTDRAARYLRRVGVPQRGLWTNGYAGVHGRILYSVRKDESGTR